MNYVKFLRGTPAAFAKLASKDLDTLYFISESGATTGKLYLGDKLIAGSTGSGATDLNSLTDVVINSTGLVDGDLLVYDWQSQKWVNKAVTDVLAEVMTGATATAKGKAGLVPEPQAGDQDKFLKGDGTWGTVTASLSEADASRLTAVEGKMTTLIGSDANKSVRTIATEALTAALIPADAKESLDTLQEISAWIQQHPEDISQINSDISGLQTTVGTLSNAINGTTGENPTTGLLSRVSTLEDVLNDKPDGQGGTTKGLVSIVNSLISPTDASNPYVLKTTFNTQVGDFSKLNHSIANSTIIDEINSINDRLVWKDMAE